MNLKKPTAIITGDWHLRDDHPVCRTDDFEKSQWKKVDFIAELGAKYQCPVIHTGDLFNHWKPSPYLITQTMRHLPDNFWTVYGNHDLPQHSLELADKCGMNVLAEAGKLVILPYGTHWGQKPIGASFPSYQGQFAENVSRKVLVWHVMTWLKELPWPGCTDAPALQLLKDHPEYDLIATGHNHKSFVAGLKGRLLINPGGITRQAADQADFKPAVYVWYAEGNTYERVELPIEHGVVTREHIEIREQRDERIAAFVDRLDDDWEVSMSFEENLERFRATNNIRESVMKIIYESLEL